LAGSALAAIIALLRLLETTTMIRFGLALLTVAGIAALPGSASRYSSLWPSAV
jgi:hypothetical protein